MCCRSAKGSLYPALHKLEQQEGYKEAEWKQTENNRRAKFYALTRLGKKQLESEAANWQRLSSAISQRGSALGGGLGRDAIQTLVYTAPLRPNRLPAPAPSRNGTR